MAINIWQKHRLRDGVLKGTEVLAEAAASAMGPLGGQCVYEPLYDIPQVTNNKTAALKDFSLKDPCGNIGLEVVREAAMKTKSMTGDGMGCTVVLAREMLLEGMKNITAGANPMMN